MRDTTRGGARVRFCLGFLGVDLLLRYQSGEVTVSSLQVLRRLLSCGRCLERIIYKGGRCR